MKEYFTKALVLDQEEIGELDKLIYLYTEDLGKIAAKAKSVRKPTSKLAAHLEPLNFIRVRLVEKNNFQITDALAYKKVIKSLKALELAQLIKEMTFELQPDRKLWLTIKKIFQDLEKNQKSSYKPLLKTMGFDSDFAQCSVCGNKRVVYFSKTDQVFFCNRCALKIPKNDLILI